MSLVYFIFLLFFFSIDDFFVKLSIELLKLHLYIRKKLIRIIETN
jgi:hypothetical protein